MEKYVENMKENLKNPLFIACLVGIVMMILGVFLPVYKISFLGVTESINYFSADGKLAEGIWVILLAVVILGTHVFDKAKLACIPAIIVMFLLIRFYINVKDSTSFLGTQVGSFGIGFYTMMLGTIIAGVCSVLFGLKKEKN